ncbi:MAG TPA: IS110 family transposase [Solirubrobacterales bacterium]|nr:IS110 family transposase [Solirubrobacterales bacterium]
MRSIALDVHPSFCEVAIAEGGEVRSAGRVKTAPAELELFAQSLDPSDEVVLEATGPAMEVARIIEPHVARVVVANAAEVRAISHARVKSDRCDARTLARLLAADMLVSVWVPDQPTGALRRRVARRSALVRQRTRAKNEVHAALQRRLIGPPEASDLFGKRGREWLAALELPAEEQETVSSCLRQVGFLDAEIEACERELATWASTSADARRLMTIPGVDVVSAAALMSAIGDVRRFRGPRQLVGYLGLDPTSRQSGEGEARGGRISKRGNSHARHVLVEAAWKAAEAPGPLRAFWLRLQAGKGKQKATVAVARKLAVISWSMLTRGEDYAYGRPSLSRHKLRRAELLAGAPKCSTRHRGQRISATPEEREAEQALQRQAEAAYRRLIADWKASGPKKGAGATPGRASSRPSKRQAARQASEPQRPAL